jgi:hypothetical protein
MTKGTDNAADVVRKLAELAPAGADTVMVTPTTEVGDRLVCIVFVGRIGMFDFPRFYEVDIGDGEEHWYVYECRRAAVIRALRQHYAIVQAPDCDMPEWLDAYLEAFGPTNGPDLWRLKEAVQVFAERGLDPEVVEPPDRDMH